MSGMNFLERLLDGVAVEWKPLGDICENISSGKNKDKSDVGIYPVFGSTGVIGRTNNKAYEKEQILVARVGVNAGHVNIAEGEYDVSDNTLIIQSKENIVLKYLYYYLVNINLNQFAKGAGQPLITAGQLKTIKIPIPPIEIQAEIVRILDTFTDLTAELTAELTDRKKQYNYYRDRLLTFEKGEVEWKTLGEVALDFGRGKSKHRPRNDPKLYGGNTPFIQTGDIRNASHIIETYSQTYSEIGLKQSKLWSKGTLCITIAANIAETSILGFDACFPDSVIGFVANPEKTTSGYVEYLLSSLKTKLEEMGQGSAQSNINMGTFENLRLPFPPLAEQVRIASLLDKFDTLTHSISEGLPREIALRQEQYEYYRDLLLTFPKPEEVKAHLATVEKSDE